MFNSFFEQSAADQAKNNFFMQWGLSSTFDSVGSKVFLNKTAGQLLFDGYEDPLLSIAEWIGTKSSVPIDKFGWFYKVNKERKLLKATFLTSKESVMNLKQRVLKMRLQCY